MRPSRIVAILSITLLATSLACTTVTRAIGIGAAPTPAEAAVTAPQTDATTPALAPGQPQVTNTPRQLALEPTPTSFQVTSTEDVRSSLDLSKPDYVDYFDHPGTWFDYDTAGRAAYTFDNGHLLGTDYEPENLYTWWSYADHQSGNVYTEISATNGDCVGKDAVGFVIRVDQKSAAGGYGIEISCDGSWRFLKHRQGKQAQVMADWAPSDAINTGAGANNRLGIWAYQNHFVLFINNQQVGELYDRNSGYTFGTFAVYVRANQTYDLTAQFDDFAYWNIPFISQ